MIVRILSAGTSFKGLGAYLTHDPKSETAERVAWTHTLNLANDHIPSAIDEMMWTARDAELLKQEAGIRAGGRATENAVKHLSLNWHPDENPSREHMIETTEDFLRHMKWEHQAVLVAHDDRAHAHVHVMLNAVHPETGLKLDDSFEQRRAQAWALEYERQHENIYCENRLKPIGEREKALTRPAWEAFQDAQKEFAKSEQNLAQENFEIISEPENPKNRNSKEWGILKKFQREERQAFFAEGKKSFSELRQSVYGEVRDEFRPRWAEYYSAEKEGFSENTLKEMKAELVAEQKSLLGERRDAACAELRSERDNSYRELLDRQAGLRHELHARQKDGLISENYLAKLDFGLPPPTFRESASEVTGRNSAQTDRWQEAADEVTGGDAGKRPTRDVGDILGRGVSSTVAAVGESLFMALLGETPAPRPPPDPVAERGRLQADRDKDEADRKALEEQWARARD